MKTTIDVDRKLADEAAEILGTSSLKETVNCALREVVNSELRRQLAEQVRTGTLPVPTQEEYDELRRPKVPIGALANLDELFSPKERRRRSKS